MSVVHDSIRFTRLLIAFQLIKTGFVVKIDQSVQKRKFLIDHRIFRELQVVMNTIQLFERLVESCLIYA